MLQCNPSLAWIRASHRTSASLLGTLKALSIKNTFLKFSRRLNVFNSEMMSSGLLDTLNEPEPYCQLVNLVTTPMPNPALL